MLEPRDQKLIQKYTLLPLLARDGFLSAILLLVVSLLLTAADAVFLYQRDTYLPGIVLGFVLAVVLGAVSIYCLVADRRRPYDPAWLDLCERTLRAGPFAPNAGPDLYPGTVASFWEVPTPPALAVTVGVLLLPAAVVLSVFLPHYRAVSRTLEQNRQAATAGLESVAATLEAAGCTDVWYSDPYDYYADYGYTVRGNLKGGEEVFITPETVTVSAVVDNHGQLLQVSCTVGVDIEKTVEENLDRVRTELETANGVLRGITVPARSGDLFTPELLPDAFTEKLLAAYPYENAYNWYEAEDGVVVSTDYFTYPEEEYGEYDSAYIRVSAEVPDAWE